MTFGDAWVQESVLEIFREQIARFRVILSTPDIEDPMEALSRGEAPDLGALRLHNGTVYRWNRACYGKTNGVAHLRIENRVLPAGPTIVDEVANAAFFFGLMSGVLEEIGNPRDRIDFDDAKGNFYAAARLGLKAQFTWVDGETVTSDSDALGKATGKQVEVKVIIDPSVKGGLVAQVGETVIDGSVRRRLDQLRNTL